MSNTVLAQQVTDLIAPLLPVLTAVGQEAAKGLLSALGKDTWAGIKVVWDRIWPAIQIDGEAAAAIKRLESAPNDPDARSSVTQHLERLLERDSAFREEAARLPLKWQEVIAENEGMIKNVVQDLKGEGGQRVVSNKGWIEGVRQTKSE